MSRGAHPLIAEELAVHGYRSAKVVAHFAVLPAVGVHGDDDTAGAGANGCIEPECHIPENCVLGDNVTVGKGSKLAHGARIEPDSYIEPYTTQS